MEDLLTCPWKVFIEKIREISNTHELQNILWQLENEYLKVLRSKNITKKFTFEDAKGIDEIKTANQKLIMESRLKKRLAQKAFEELPKEMLLKRKVQFCRETLLMLKNKSREKIAESISRDDYTFFSFGIKQKQEPERLFKTRCQYRKANKITKGSMVVTHCGDLKWYDAAGLTIDQIENRFKSTILPIQANNTNQEEMQFKGKDIQLAMREELKKRGELKLIRIQIDADDRQEDSIEYFMMISTDSNLNWNDPEIQTFFTQTYLSNTYRGLAAKASRTGECLYGGRIVRNSEGKLELRFYQDEIKGVAKASKTKGTTRTPEGKGKRQSLKNMIIGIRNDLAARALRTAFEQPAEEGERE